MIRAWQVEVLIGEGAGQPRQVYRATVNATSREIALLLFVAELTRLSE